MTTSHEHVAEALLDLERAYVRERELRQQLDVVLATVRDLASADDEPAVFARLVDVVRSLLGAEGAAILRQDGKGLRAEVSTHDTLGGRWSAGPATRRTLRGTPVTLFDVARAPEWAGRSGAHQAALLVPLADGEAAAVLVCTHPERGFFTRDHLRTAEHIAPIAVQALGRIRTLQEVRRGRDAKAASEAKSRFLANMSHELRTPLNAILGYVELIREELDDPDGAAHEDLHQVERAGRHLLGLINDVLDLSRIEAGKATVRAEDVDLDELLGDITRTVHPLVADHGNRFVVERIGALPPMHTDPAKVRQILLNLLSNAAKFTRDGTVLLVVRPRGHAIELVVEDTGEGIPPDALERVFHAFEQVDDSPTRTTGGTGLGLAITRRLCQLLGGTLSAESEVGRGSTFTACLPLSSAEQQDVAPPVAAR